MFNLSIDGEGGDRVCNTRGSIRFNLDVFWQPASSLPPSLSLSRGEFHFHAASLNIPFFMSILD